MNLPRFRYHKGRSYAPKGIRITTWKQHRVQDFEIDYVLSIGISTHFLHLMYVTNE